MPFAAIYVPDFPVEAILRAEPALREQAVAVMEGTPPLLRVLACNGKAAQAGVEAGMTRMQAGALLPESGIRARSTALEASAHAALLDCACAFSPRVEDTAADSVLLDLAGLERIFGSPAKIACDLVRRCSEMGLEANVGVAENPDTALLAARGFTGATVIAPGKEGERLGELPVDVLLDVGSTGESAVPQKSKSRIRQQRTKQMQKAQILETLDRWGVRNLRALAALPEVAITERLGQQGLHLQRLARGAVSRPLVPVEPPLEFEEVAELEYPVELLEPLAFVLNRMLEQLCARLEARALSTHELQLRLELEGTQDSPQRRGDAEEDISDLSFPIAEWKQQKSGGRGVRRHASNVGADTNQKSENSNQKSAISNRKFFASPRLCGEGVVHERTLHVPVPLRDAKVFLKLLQLDLNMSPPAAPVRKIWLRAEPVRPRVAQGGLFLPATPPPEKLELTLARIAGVLNSPQRRGGAEEGIPDFSFPDSELESGGRGVRRHASLGGANTHQQSEIRNQQPSASLRLRGEAQQRLGSPELLDTHRPGAFRMRRFVPPDARAMEPGRHFAEAEKCGTLPVTALRILRPPVSVAVEAWEGRPLRLACEERAAFSGEVVWTAGPWRSSGEWWDGTVSDAGRKESSEVEFGWSREEWDVAVRSGTDVTVCRVCREFGLWKVEGVYD